MPMFAKVGDTFHGFTVTRIREVSELNGRVIEMTFDQTGTQLVWLDNNTENKLFSISFKTLPEDSTGVFHILEHSVLCGSAKYPVREPFVELLKSSMNTFLNAMTWSDKTMYPVSSRNERDFLNLVSVYLDAVFAPNILTQPDIFYQEGWHIEPGEGSDSYNYKGVVFNEMKGAMSSPDGLSEYKLAELLFPDTSYGYNSGGDPAVIPELSYEQFCETYHRFYHPSNAQIYLDGSIPAEETFAMLEEYLSQFARSTDLPEIKMQTPKSAYAEIDFDLDQNEELENQSILCTGKIFNTWKDRAKDLAVMVLKDVLAGSNEAPLKRAVLSAGLAKQMYITVDDSIPQQVMYMQFERVTDGKADEILPFVRKTVAEILEQGLDRKALEASVNRMEYHLLAPDSEPTGLNRCFNCMTSWLYGGDPILYMVSKDAIAAVRRMLEDDSFEQLARELFLDENGLAVLKMNASHTRGEELRQEEAERLAAVTGKWNDTDRAANAALNEHLLNWQQTPDTPEKLATLPTLPLSAISAETSWTETELKDCAGMKILYHPVESTGIVYVSLFFENGVLPAEELLPCTLFAGLFGRLATEHYNALALSQELKNITGEFSVDLRPFGDKDDTSICRLYTEVSFSCLKAKLEDAQKLVLEILRTTDFSAKEKIRELFIQKDEYFKQLGVNVGHALSKEAASSHYNAATTANMYMSGLPAIHEMHRIVRDFDTLYEQYTAKFAGIRDSLFVRARLTASTASVEYNGLERLLNGLPEGEKVENISHYVSPLPKQLAYPIPAQIGYAAQSWNLNEAGKKYTGSYSVAATLISLSYLWVTVRVQGGAYGTGLSAVMNGAIDTYSYRDPSPAGALRANKEIAAFLRQFCASEEPLEKFIISTLSANDPLRSPQACASVANIFWLKGITRDDLRRSREEMLATTKETLLSLCETFEQFAEQGAVCVCAAENLLAGCPQCERYEF